jgi:subfamily B ATP-binding cassette protein MsbA
MNTYWKLLKFGRPLEKYAIPYFFYTLLYSFFNVFTMVLVAPVLKLLFESPEHLPVVTQLPPFDLSTAWVEDAVVWGLYKIYGADYQLTSVVVAVAIALVVSALLSNLFRYLGQYTVENLRINAIQRIRSVMYDKVMSLNVGYFSNERKGDIISKFSSDAQVVQSTISATMHVIFREPFLIAMYLVWMVAMSWQLTLFAVVFLPLVAFVIGSIVRRLRKPAKAAQNQLGEMVSQLDETLSGIKIIKSYNAEGYSTEKYRGMNALFSRISRSMARRQQLASPISEFLGIAAVGVMLIFGATLVFKGQMAGSDFIVFVGIFSQLTRPVRSFADAFGTINQGIAAGERIFGLLDTAPTITDSPKAVEMKSFEREIEFRNVTFRYEEREVISGVSFKIKKGETVALVGPSGGGKSTLSDLIPRFYDPQGGEVLIDGRGVKEYTMHSLRAHLGMVAQETVLFNDTIEGNIRLGSPDATMSEVEQAARIANAHNFIMETPEGYETNIGDRGVKLSGGQRQRLSIARAVLKNPDILILDEATSALDTESEKLVQDALDSLLRGRTSLVIAHRLSTIRNADWIIVVDHGRIIEQGRHDELMAARGTYFRLVDMQQLA